MEEAARSECRRTNDLHKAMSLSVKPQEVLSVRTVNQGDVSAIALGARMFHVKQLSVPRRNGRAHDVSASLGTEHVSAADALHRDGKPQSE